MENFSSEVYLSDLNENMQNQYINDWKRKGNSKFLEAVENGETILVGRYYIDEDCSIG